MASSNLVPVQLQDERGTVYTVLLDAAEARRCETDVAFCQGVLNATVAEVQRTEVAEPGPSSSGSAVSSRGGAGEDAEGSSFKWTHAAILLLVELYRQAEPDLTSGKTSQKKVWANIARMMSSNGHMVTGPQCVSKFTGMKRTFKAISDHNSKSGSNPRSWPYFELMESLLGERPFMVPPALSSSTAGCSAATHSTREDSGSISEPTTQRSDSERRSRKRPAAEDLSAVAAAIIESRKIAEENKNRCGGLLGPK